jgi:hypothetical protein
MKEIIKAGTILTIDSEFIKRIEDAVKNGNMTDMQSAYWLEALPEEYLKIKIEFKATRVDRKRIRLAWYYLDRDNKTNIAHYNLSLFDYLGYTIVHPEQVEIPLMEADDEILSPKELVLKTMIRRKAKDGKARAWCESVFNMVTDAMDECDVVFYQP